jgi:putative membrane protein
MRLEQKSLTVEVGSASPGRGRSAGRLGLAMAAALPSLPALAHGTAPDGWHDLSRAWSGDLLVTVPLSVSCLLFARGAFRLHRRLGRFPPGFGAAQIAAFAAGAAVLVIALLSPLEGLAEALLSAHMVQHVLLVTLAPPLLVLGKPEVAWLWALPTRWRRAVPRQRQARSAFRLLAPLAKPVPAAMIHLATLWLWHAPALFDAAVTAPWLHWLEHLCFFGTALLFWRAVIRAAAGREAAAGGLVACFVTLLQSGILSALLSFAREPLFRTTDAAAWGLTALEDQQLAGAIMSVPMGIVYLGAGLAMAARLLTPPTAEQAKASVVSSPPVPKPSR